MATPGWFGVLDPVAAVLDRPALLLDLPGAGFEVVDPWMGVCLGARGRVLGLWSDRDDLWADLEVVPVLGTVGLSGDLTSAKAVRDRLTVPLLLRCTRPCEVSP